MQQQLPKLACDCHAHVFGPYDRFPLAASRTYDPPESPVNTYLNMLDEAGFARGVLVHAAANGWDNSATLDALTTAPDRLRGIAVVPLDTDDTELEDMHKTGIRGIRFNHILGSKPEEQVDGRLGLPALGDFAPRLRDLGWHAQIWANADIIAENESWLRSLHLPLVIDHMGMFDVTRGVDDAAFQSLVRLVKDGIVFVKLTVFRNSKESPEFDDVRRHHDVLVAANPSRLLWGCDWPFLGMKGDPAYSTTRLVAKALDWWSDETLAQTILVTNPAALYGFPPGSGSTS